MQSITKIYITAFIIAVVVIGAAFVAYKPAVTTDDIRLKTFASEQELKDFLKNTQNYQGSYEARTMTAEQSAPSAGAKASDYSSTNIQVEGVDEADFVKNDGKYIYIISGGNLVIVDAYPAESASIISNTTIENPQEIFVNGDSLIVFSSPYSYKEPVLGTEEKAEKMYYPRYVQKVKIQVYDISDRSAPVVEKEFTVDGTYYDSRMIDGKVYAIVNSYPSYNYDTGILELPEFSPENEKFPQIYYPDMPSSSYTFTNVIEFDTEGSFDNKVFLFGSTNVMYVSKDNIYVTYERYIPYYDTQKMMIEKALLPLLPADVAQEIKSIFSQPFDYEKQQAAEKVLNKYIQTLSSEEQQKFYSDLQERGQQVQAEIAKEQQKTIVHKISLKNLKYEASGEFSGRLLNQFSMDEYNGNLRVATTVSGGFGGATVGTVQPVRAEQTAIAESVAVPTDAAVVEGTVKNDKPVETIVAPPRPRSGNVNNVYVLDENLKVIGELEDLAPGESIFSARFIENRLYLVTFIRIDPLFVIDLSVPSQPRVLGELKIPGVSQYLHPYDNTHIIGVGMDATDGQGRTMFTGVKISLFDVSDVAAPKEEDNYIIGKQGSSTPITYEHKSFLFDKQKNVMVIPVSINDYSAYEYNFWTGAYVFSFTPENKISLTGTVTHDNRAVERSLYMDNVLYTISQAKIKMNSLTDLSEINEIDLPKSSYYGYGDTGGVPTTI